MAVNNQDPTTKLKEVEQEIRERFRALADAIGYTSKTSGQRLDFFSSRQNTLTDILSGKHDTTLSDEVRAEAQALAEITEELDRVPAGLKIR